MAFTKPENIVIIGATQAYRTLRQFGCEWAVRGGGDKPVLPYTRPLVSRACMKSEIAEKRFYFEPELRTKKNKIDIILSGRAERIDRKNHASDHVLARIDHLVIRDFYESFNEIEC